MIIVETRENALKYVKQIEKRIQTLFSSYDSMLLPRNMAFEISTTKKDVVSFILLCNRTLTKTNSYEAPQDWMLQKKHLNKLFNTLSNKISIATEYLKSMQNTRQ